MDSGVYGGRLLRCMGNGVGLVPGKGDRGLGDYWCRRDSSFAYRTSRCHTKPYNGHAGAQAREIPARCLLFDFYMWIGLVSTSWDLLTFPAAKLHGGHSFCTQVHVACHATQPRCRKADLKSWALDVEPYHQESGIPYTRSRLAKLSAVGRAYQ